MSQHTPGPWTFTKNDDGVRRIKAPSHAGSLMCDERYYPWCPAEDADWRLIAAAPDLLAALRELVTLWDSPEPFTGADALQAIGEATERARAAIAKAREGATD